MVQKIAMTSTAVAMTNVVRKRASLKSSSKSGQISRACSAPLWHMDEEQCSEEREREAEHDADDLDAGVGGDVDLHSKALHGDLQNRADQWSSRCAARCSKEPCVRG